jgi:hypothetical protein
MLERPVEGAFRIGRKTTGGKLPAAKVIPKALAADGLVRARFVSAVAVLPVLSLCAIHTDTFEVRDSGSMALPRFGNGNFESL